MRYKMNKRRNKWEQLQVMRVFAKEKSNYLLLPVPLASQVMKSSIAPTWCHHLTCRGVVPSPLLLSRCYMGHLSFQKVFVIKKIKLLEHWWRKAKLIDNLARSKRDLSFLIIKVVLWRSTPKTIWWVNSNQSIIQI